MNLDTNVVWIAVRSQRGFITDAELFLSRDAAEACESEWREVANPDYDESAVIFRPFPSAAFTTGSQAT
jgi:hypothetical protein